MPDDRSSRDVVLPWVLAVFVMTLVGMIMLIAAGILAAGGWSAFLIGPIVLAVAALTAVAVTVRHMRSRRRRSKDRPAG